MDRLHKIHLIERKGTWRRHMVRERLTRKQNTSRPDDVWPDMWKHVSDAAKQKARQRWAIEKPKLDNARQLRGTFFIEPNAEELKLTMKAARRKLEVPMPAAMPCKIPIKNSGEKPSQYWETQDKIRLFCWCWRKHETKARRSSTQTSSRSYHCKKGWISITHYSLVHNFFPMPQAMKIPDPKAAVVKELGKLKKIPAWQLTKVRNKKEVID